MKRLLVALLFGFVFRVDGKSYEFTAEHPSQSDKDEQIPTSELLAAKLDGVNNEGLTEMQRGSSMKNKKRKIELEDSDELGVELLKGAANMVEVQLILNGAFHVDHLEANFLMLDSIAVLLLSYPSLVAFSISQGTPSVLSPRRRQAPLAVLSKSWVEP